MFAYRAPFARVTSQNDNHGRQLHCLSVAALYLKFITIQQLATVISE